MNPMMLSCAGHTYCNYLKKMLASCLHFTPADEYSQIEKIKVKYSSQEERERDGYEWKWLSKFKI